MLSLLIMMLALAADLPPVAQGRDYTVDLAGARFTEAKNASDCETCTQYTKHDSVSGSFSTSRPLPADTKDLNISDIVTAYRFGDGHNIITSQNKSSRKASFAVWTDANAKVVGYLITVEQDVARTHPRRINAISMINANGIKGEIAFANVVCTDLGPTAAEPKANDICRGNKLDNFSSRAERSPEAKKPKITTPVRPDPAAAPSPSLKN